MAKRKSTKGQTAHSKSKTGKPNDLNLFGNKHIRLLIYLELIWMYLNILWSFLGFMIFCEKWLFILLILVKLLTITV
jgi:hypothetical protein